jgi:2-polyprenyl-6-methoxyphenol hydroxylase-like FAD-dependent oxidoreductase
MVKEIIIVGGGSAGWMAAIIMAKAWVNHSIRITLIESADVGIIGVGEGSTPALKSFFDQTGIPEAEWMPECNATYKCGITFANWSTRAGFEHYYHPFPSAVDNHTLPLFIHNAQQRLAGVDVHAHPNRFFLSQRLAERSLAPKAHHNFPFETQYGYHFDAVLLGKFLRRKAMSMGVIHRECHVQDVVLDQQGNIEHLVTSEGEVLRADFFVDASGFNGLLIQKALQTPFVSYSSQLFNDAAVALPSDITEKIPTQTFSTALKHGWAWKIPLTNRYGNGYVYSSTFCSADQAEQELREHLELLEADVPVRHLKMKVGRVEQHWNSNCLAVGLAQGFIEPLEATALFLIQQTVAIFVEMFERGDFTMRHQAAFNQRINQQFDGTRDYILTHYKTSSRTDTDYWRANTAGYHQVSDSLRELYQCWMTGGDLGAEVRRQDIGKYYPVTSWYCIFAGMGLFADPKNLRSPTIAEHRHDLKQLDDFLARCALNYDDHREVLRRMAAAQQ